MAVVDAVAVDAVAAKRWGVMGGGRRGSEPPCHAEGAARAVEEAARSCVLSLRVRHPSL